jgi:hypothetical protein
MATTHNFFVGTGYPSATLAIQPQEARNLRNFGAPCGIYYLGNRSAPYPTPETF